MQLLQLHVVEAGVSSSVRSMCADPKCVDMLPGVSGMSRWSGFGIEFPDFLGK